MKNQTSFSIKSASVLSLTSSSSLLFIRLTASKAFA
jgi:hypothetical protein